MKQRALQLIALVVLAAACERQQPADVVFYNGHITGTDATALATRGHMIVAVGSDERARKLIGDTTRVVDLAGRFVVASLTDAHGHILWYGQSLAEVDLRGCRSADECAQRVAARCRETHDAWVFGRGWDDTAFADNKPPTAALLETACPGRAVWLRRIDEHAGWASPSAMRLAGVTGDGIFVDAASAAIEAQLPAPTPEQRRSYLLAAQKSLLAMGLTSVHEMGVEPETESVLRTLEQTGELALRVVGYADHGGLKRPLDEVGLLARLQRAPDRAEPDRLFTMQGVKLWADGALGSRGASLLADYSDAPGQRGASMLEHSRLESIARAAVRGHWQLAVHAIGDEANHAVLDAYQAAGCRTCRFRIEHAQVIAPQDLARLASLGVLASMQPTHATSDMRWVAERLGEERLRGAYAWRTLAKSGAVVLFGSDFPVESPNPWEGLHAAVTRTNALGEPIGGWRPNERFSRLEALSAFTDKASYGAFQESFRGKPAVGQVADLTVIDRDVLAETALRDTRVDLTMVGGRIVHER